MKIALTLFVLVLFYSCNDSDGPIIDFQKVETATSDSLNLESDKFEAEIPAKQTKEERIAEIKAMYAELLIIEPSDEKVCKEKAQKYTSDLVVKGMEFENRARSCQFESDFSYKKVILNGYEWGSETVYYYKNKQLFFVYVNGGAEGWAYEQRIYYDREGEVIRILEDENDGGGEKPSKRLDVTSVNRGGEILNELKVNLAKFNEIMAQ